MSVQVLFNFILSKDKSDVFLMSGDFDWLYKNVFHESEFYIGMNFNHNGCTYILEELIYCLPQRKSVYWSQADHDCYFGEPCKSNFDLYIRCSKK